MNYDPDFFIRDGVLLKYYGTKETVVIPEGVTKIDNYAFRKSSLTKIVIPGYVKTIGRGAFEECRNLKKAVITHGTEEIYSEAFSFCTQLSSISLPDSITEIGNFAFRNCKFRKIRIPRKIKTLSRGLFHCCHDLEQVTLPGDLKKIGEGAFKLCSSMIRFDLPEGLRVIGREAFAGCRCLKKLDIPDSVRTIGIGAFKGCFRLTATGFLIIRGELYAYFGTQKTITVPGNVTNIRADFLEEMLQPNSIIALHLPLEKMPSGVKLKMAAGFAIAYERGDKIPEEQYRQYVNYIRHKKKALCHLTVKIPGLLKLMIAEKIIKEDDYDEIITLVEKEKDPELTATLLDYRINVLPPVDPNKELLKELKRAETGIMATADAKKQWGYRKKEDGTYILTGYKGPDTVVHVPAVIGRIPVSEIGKHAFRYDTAYSEEVAEIRQKITAVFIPEGITAIGEEAFLFCGALTTAALPNSLKTIDKSAFACCGALTDLHLPIGLNKIGFQAFYNCYSLITLVIPDGTKEIADFAFHFCDNLSEVTLPASVMKLGEKAFTGCDKLTIKAPAGSLTEKYAKEKGIPFLSLTADGTKN